MRLLVSVRSAAEARAALAGGAQIIDAKEPALGALGPVHPEELRAIAREVPATAPFSVALGEAAGADSAAHAIASLELLGERPGETYVKLGMAAGRSARAAERIAAAAIRAGAASPLRPAVILVAYADHAAPSASHRDQVSSLALQVGARGVLLDTCSKDGRNLFDHVAADRLRDWAMRARERGLLVALAGSLSEAGVERAANLPVDIVGVRGAACDGGREGVIAAARVRRLRSSLTTAARESKHRAPVAPGWTPPPVSI
jgi:uncharacterized protein (UPF0264 family)